MRKFCEVKESAKKNKGTTLLPVRSSSKSAGYDFYSKVDAVVEPGKIYKFWTDVKAYMNDDEVLILDVRSSQGGKFQLSNTIGIVDSDYADNETNDGNIGLFLKNISNETQYINIGDRIGQGIFLKYLTTDDDCVTATRHGGYGSSGK